jgi:hypothetical protein
MQQDLSEGWKVGVRVLLSSLGNSSRLDPGYLFDHGVAKVFRTMRLG